MTLGFILVVVVIIATVHALFTAATRSSNDSQGPQPRQESNNSGLFAEPGHTNTGTAGTSTKRRSPVPTTSGNGPTLTYLLQAHFTGEGWVTPQKSNGKLSGFGTINATADELTDFANAVIQPFEDGKRKLRVVFFRGDLPFNELSIEKAYGDVTPSQGGRFSPWIFMG